MAGKSLSIKETMYEVRSSLTILNIKDFFHNNPFFSENSTLGIDLSTDWTNTSLTPVQTERPPGLYARSNQALWYDDERNIIYAFGGDNLEEQSPPPPSDSIQGFTPDDNGGGHWTEVLGVVGRKPFPSNMHGTSSGMYTSDDKDAYYVGGNISERTSPSVSTPATEAFHNSGLLRLNFETIALTNSSSSGLTSDSGVLLNVPVYGSDGVLLNFGGGKENAAVGFNNINIFDKKERKWFSQIADGDIPRPRNYFCAVGVQGKNETSFEV